MKSVNKTIGLDLKAIAIETLVEVTKQMRKLCILSVSKDTFLVFRGVPVYPMSHVTPRMGQIKIDFTAREHLSQN